MDPLIVTVLSGVKYSTEFPENLSNGCRRESRRRVRFVCFTDRDDILLGEDHRKIGAVNYVKLPSERWGLDGWWWKIWVFSEECDALLRSHVGGYKRIIWIDLDTVLCGDIGFLLMARGFKILHDIYAENQWGSAVMVIPRLFCTEIWHRFRRKYLVSTGRTATPAVVPQGAADKPWRKRSGGDQLWLRWLANEKVFKVPKDWCLQWEFPGRLVSYKGKRMQTEAKLLEGLNPECREATNGKKTLKTSGSLRALLSVILFHGRPLLTTAIGSDERLHAKWRGPVASA